MTQRWRRPKRTSSQCDQISCHLCRNLQMEDDKDHICVNGDCGYITSEFLTRNVNRGICEVHGGQQSPGRTRVGWVNYSLPSY